MRFGLVHRIMTDALAALGLLALITSGHLGRTPSIVLLVGLTLAVLLPERWLDRATLRYAGLILPIGLLATQAGRLFLGGAILNLAIEFAAGLQIIRLVTRRGAAHDQQVIVLALLHLIAATVLGGGLAYGLCFVGFLVIAPGALVLSHLRREVEGNYRQGARDRTGLPVDVPRILRSRRVIGRPFLLFTCFLSVPIFAFTAVLFVLFPRVGLSLLLLNRASPERMVGFSDRVDLGGVGKLRTDPTIAMRVEYPAITSKPDPPARIALYLRGTAFDRYDGTRWSRSKVDKQPLPHHGQFAPLLRYPRPGTDRKLVIDLEPIDPPVLFLPPEAVALRLPDQPAPLLGQRPTLYAAAEDQVRYETPDHRGLRYEVYLASSNESFGAPLSYEDRQRYLKLPSGLSPDIVELARTWVGGQQDPLASATAIERRLRKDYAYDLDSPSGNAPDPLRDFLFESKRGHCEYYSTAMAILLRTLGVPTRNVTGFVGGTYNRFGHYYAVRQGDAHSWVEVYLEGQGWRRFDPTPPSNAAPQTDITGVLAFVRDLVEATSQRWSRHVVGYDLRQQVDLLRSVRSRYDRLRTRHDFVGAVFASPRRLALLTLGILLVGTGAWLLYRRRPTSLPPGAQPADEGAATHQAVQLYRSLEAALAAHGVPRPSSTPPLAHARALAEAGHPVGPEAVALTRLYLQARFGRQPLNSVASAEFEHRVKALRIGRTSRAA